jgi:hypothetical protein
MFYGLLFSYEIACLLALVLNIVVPFFLNSQRFGVGGEEVMQRRSLRERVREKRAAGG